MILLWSEIITTLVGLVRFYEETEEAGAEHGLCLVYFSLQTYLKLYLSTKCRCFSCLIGWSFYGSLVHKEVADALCAKHVKTGLCFCFHYLEKQGCACCVSCLVMNTQRDPVATRPRSDTLGRPVRTLRVKMVLLGGSGVGKSSLAVRFVRSEFRSMVPTVGCKLVSLIIPN